MNLALVGVGAAGGRIVDRLLDYEAVTNRQFCNGKAIVFDTSPDAFGEFSHVGADRQVLIGDTYPGVEGEGTGGDVDLGASVAQADIGEIRRELDSAELGLVDAIILVVGFGGGTGGGAGAVVLETLEAMYEVPVYVAGILPHGDESDDRIRNAARTLQSVVPVADNTVLFDNDAWAPSGEVDSVDYDETNAELATRLAVVFGAGEVDSSSVAAMRVDSSDVARTLATGGVSTIGLATTGVDAGSGGLLAWLRSLLGDSEEEAPSDAASVASLVRRAVNGRLTLPCEVTSAERSLMMLSGPSSACSRKGFESARHWLGEETGTVEVLAGDEPRESASELAAVVLLSNVTDVPRVDEIQRRATND
ncbi:MAG: tubulin/FtsZ family protein [Haloarculaceae archaeon]